MRDFRHKKSLGQHFLAAPEILDATAELLPIKGKSVLEIGAGDGALTDALVQAGAKVTALEVDGALVELLEKKFFGKEKNGGVQIVRQDALEYDFSKFKLFFGNIPYNISTPILLKLLETKFEHAVLMLQAEFGERLVANPSTKNYSRLSVFFQSKANAEVVEWVSRDCFYPIPRVDSVLVHIAPKKKNEAIRLDEELVNALFQHPNQNLRKALRHSEHLLGKQKISLLLEKIPADLLKKSAREVSLQEFEMISKIS